QSEAGMSSHHPFKSYHTSRLAGDEASPAHYNLYLFLTLPDLTYRQDDKHYHSPFVGQVPP
ncbi:hypothetical protein, partial [Pseudomonas plecoglossicida]